MPVIIYNEDKFSYPEFIADFVFSIDDVIEEKLWSCHLNESQVYEWLPYTHEEENEVPADEKERFEWLKGMNITQDTTDEEVINAQSGYAVRFAKTAARFRAELVERYGAEKGSKVRFAEAFQLSEYGRKPDEKELKELFSL